MALLDWYDAEEDKSQLLKTEALAKELTDFREQALVQLKETYIPSLFNNNANPSFKVVKRIPFNLDFVNKDYRWIKTSKETENFGEIVNQMANVEGMIACLNFFKGDVVELAHPTQTSNNKRPVDNDLILVSSTKRYIEISDVIATSGDSNNKFQKDVNSLYRSFSEVGEGEFYVMTSSDLWDYHQKKCKQEGQCYKRFCALNNEEEREPIRLYVKTQPNFITITPINGVEDGFALLKIDFSNLK